MKSRKSGLSSGSSIASVMHSDVTSEKHAADVKAGGRSRFSGSTMIAIEPSDSESFKKPFLKKGALKTDFISKAVWFGDGEKGKFTSSSVMSRRQRMYIHEALKNGVYRVTMKKGKRYLRKKKDATETDIMQRHTYVLPPHLSLLYRDMNEESKKQMWKLIAVNLTKQFKVRWPEATIKGLQLHDDTGHLHVDVWGLKGEKETYKPRGEEEKEVFRFETKIMAQLGAGPGACFLDRKKRVRGDLHVEDEKKLKGALKAYENRRKRTKKEMPEIPADMAWYRNLDSILESHLTKSLPQSVAKAKESYVEYCQNADSGKYGALDKLNQLDDIERQIMEDREISSQEKEESERLLESSKKEFAKLEADRATLEGRKNQMINLRKLESTMLEILRQKNVLPMLKKLCPIKLIQLGQILQNSSKETSQKAGQFITSGKKRT